MLILNKAAKPHKIKTVCGNLIAVGALCVSPAFARDRDNKPPGPIGGPGMSLDARPGKKAWYYNPPGPIGGPGAGPYSR